MSTMSVHEMGHVEVTISSDLESAGSNNSSSSSCTSEAPQFQKPKDAKREDIQVLRALAVSAVVLFHLGLPWMKGGFIGVDIFFVISGFLVFGSVMGNVFWASLQGANIHELTKSGGYFEDMSPSIVLHYWSLAVEEQLYILVPPSKWRFYFVASRFWEFGLGALVAHYEARIFSNRLVHLQPRLSKWYWVALAGYPNYLTLPVCLITAFVIACKMDVRAPGLRFLGDMSYSVYLYHWPIIVISRLYADLSMTQVPWAKDGNAFVAPALRVNAFGGTLYDQDPEWKESKFMRLTPAQRLLHRTRRAAMAIDGDSHIMQFWKLLYNLGSDLNVTYWQGGVSHDRTDFFELLWNPPAFWSPENYEHRLALIAFRNRFGELPDWKDGNDFKRYVRQWIRKSTCTVVLVDNPIFVDARGNDLPLDQRPLECLRHRDPRDCVYDQDAVLRDLEVRWVREILAESPELRPFVDMVSLNDLVCWGGKCHSHVHEIPTFSDASHYTTQYLDYARNFIVARLRSSHCYKALESLMNATTLLDTNYGPAAEHTAVL
eukprot:m51a1_g11013 hypothetical protein (546) ;mRNA; f:379892-382427